MSIMEETRQSTSGSKMPIIIIGVIILVAVLGFVAVKAMQGTNQTASDSMTHESMTADTSVTPSASPSGAAMTADTSAEKVITMDAGSFYYSVKNITVKKGEKVKIVMTSKDMMHDFNIDELNVHMPVVKSGETGTIEFTADTVGTFEYYCAIGQHRKMGQVGKITVE